MEESLQEDPEDNSKETPLSLKEKAFLGFQCSLLYPERVGDLHFEGCTLQHGGLQLAG